VPKLRTGLAIEPRVVHWCTSAVLMDIVSEAEPRHGLHTPSTTHFRLFTRTTVHNRLRISCLSLAFEAWTCHSGFILGHFLTSDIDY
jgi:hypothetical protein